MEGQMQLNLSYVTFQRNIEIGSHKKVFAKYKFHKYVMHCEGKIKLRSHNTSCCLTEVVTKASLTVTLLTEVVTKASLTVA